MLLHSVSIFCVDTPPERDGMVNRDTGYKRTSALDRNRVPISQDNDNGNCLCSGVESTAPQVVERVYKSAQKIIQEPIYSHTDLPTSEDDGASSDVKKERDRIYSEADTLTVQDRDHIYSEADILAVQERDRIYSEADTLAVQERDRIYSEADILAVQERDRIYSEADILAVQERDRIYSGADTTDHIYSGTDQSISEDSGHVYISGNSAHNEHTYARGK